MVWKTDGPLPLHIETPRTISIQTTFRPPGPKTSAIISVVFARLSGDEVERSDVNTLAMTRACANPILCKTRITHGHVMPPEFIWLVDRNSLLKRNGLDFLAGPETVFRSQTVKYAEALFLEIGKG